MLGLENLGHYERRLSLLLFLSSIPNGFSAFLVLILHFTPPHRCDVQGKNQLKDLTIDHTNHSGNLHTERILNLTIPLENTDGKISRSKCFQFESWNISQKNKTKIPCKSMYFEGIEISAVTDFNLVCDRAWLKPVVTSVRFSGVLLGASISGYLSDRFGRRPVFLIFTAWEFIIVFILSFATKIWTYALLFLLSGVGSLVNYNTASVIGSEMTSKQYRLWMYFILLLGYSLGYMLMSPLAYWLRNWRWFLRFYGLIGVLYIPYYWLIDETPRWLLATGRVSEAKKVSQNISRINKGCGKKIVFIPKRESQETFTVIQTIVKIGKEPVLLFRLVISAFMWCTIGFMYYALGFNTNNLSANRFLNIFLSSLSELGGGILFFVCGQKLGRVNSYILPTTLFGLSMILTCFVPKNQVAILISLDMLGKFLMAFVYAIVYVQILELFPTKVRQTVMFFVVVASKVGAVLAPFFIYVGESGDILVPSLVVAGLVLLSAFGCAFLPETKGTKLPESVAEAKEMSRKRWCASGKSARDPTLQVSQEMRPLEDAKEQENQ